VAFALFFVQAHEELVSAVDANSRLLVAGFEDSNVGVWTIEHEESDGEERVVVPRAKHILRRDLG